MAKLYASEMAGRVADRAVQIFGGRGYMHDTAAARFYRELRVDRIWEGTSEIQRLIIARGPARSAAPRRTSAGSRRGAHRQFRRGQRRAGDWLRSRRAETRGLAGVDGSAAVFPQFLGSAGSGGLG